MSPPAHADGRFRDDDGSIFEEDIERIAELGVTRGCNPPANDRFCPDESVTRGQMAAFLSRALGLEAATGDRFVDDDGSVFEEDIEKLAAAGITLGCNPPANNRFCPQQAMRRGQMAAMLVRAFHYEAAGSVTFVDDDGTVFEDEIERLAAAGVTRGCNPPANDRFCPSRPVRRGQMAAFLNRALSGDQPQGSGEVHFAPGDTGAMATTETGIVARIAASDIASSGVLSVEDVDTRHVAVSATGLKADAVVAVSVGETAGESVLRPPGSSDWQVPADRRTSAGGTTIDVVATHDDTELRWERAAPVDLDTDDHSPATVPPELAIERREGIGGALCEEADPDRVAVGAPLPVRVCSETTTGLVKIVNESRNWVNIEVVSGSATAEGAQYDGPDGPRRPLDHAILTGRNLEPSRLPPNGAVDYRIPVPYVGDVGFRVEIDKLNTLVAPILNTIPGDVAGNIGAAEEVADVSLQFEYCLDQTGGTDAGCAAGWVWDVAYALVRNGVGSLLSLPWDLAVSLVENNRDLFLFIKDGLSYYGNGFTIRGPDTPPTQDTDVPVGQQPPARTVTGELYGPGVSVCAATYPGHPRPEGSWSASVDINAAEGDYGRALAMPWDGTVAVHTTGHGGGWGNSWILTRSDGYQLFVAHGLETLATGSVSAGTVFGRAGNTGTVLGEADHGGAHVHLNARKNGSPAPIDLGGTRVEPGVCWVTRSAPADPEDDISPPDAGTTRTVRLAQGVPAPFGHWYDVTLRGFPPNSTIPVACHDADDRSFYIGHLETDGSGSAHDATTCYSAVGGKQVTAGGITVDMGQSGSESAPSNPGTPPVGDEQSLRLLQGAPAPFGHWFDVTLRGFPANSTIPVACHDADDRSFYVANLRTDASGTARDTTTCYSAIGGNQVTADGLTANLGQTVTRDNGGQAGPSPTPSYTLTLRRGARAEFGYWYDLSITGPPNASITVYCNDSADSRFWTQDFRLNAQGRAADSTLCFSGDGPRHWVTSSVGVDSNTVTW